MFTNEGPSFSKGKIIEKKIKDPFAEFTVKIFSYPVSLGSFNNILHKTFLGEDGFNFVQIKVTPPPFLFYVRLGFVFILVLVFKVYLT